MIVILEDDDRRREAMKVVLERIAADVPTLFFDKCPDMIPWLRRNLSDCTVIILDHDLGPSQWVDGQKIDPGTGRDIVEELTKHSPRCPVLIHTSNTLAGPGMELSLETAGWKNDRVFPYGDLEWIEASWAGALETLLATSKQSKPAKKSGLKMYLLVRDDLELGFAVLAAAHASLAAYLKFEDDALMKEWVSGVFAKVVCRVNEKEFEKAKSFKDCVVLTESALGGREVAIAFKPRREWPKPFRYYALYR